MATTQRWTIKDLEQFPDPVDDTRYEIIDGELYVSTQPSLEHQYTCNQVATRLTIWSEETGAGIVLPAPGVIFADDDNVAPDVTWVSIGRLRQIQGEDRKLHGPPELMVEVLSPGQKNEQRDRDAKLRLYSRRRVDEYWIVNPFERSIDVFRFAEDAGELRLVRTLSSGDALESPLLPGFRVEVGSLFFPADLV